MKKLADGFFMSATMFSILPLPRPWNDEARPYIMPMFPIVGAIIGGLWYGISRILQAFDISNMLSAAVLLFFPLFASGFIHLDGYMDTSDALFSRAETAKKHAILKDSHVGAFAVIALSFFLFLGFAAIFTSLERNTNTALFIFIPILSRSIAGIALLNIKPIFQTGFGASFRKNTRPIHSVAPAFFGAASLIAGYLYGGLPSLLPLLALIFSGILAARYAVKQLGGISGDLCGFIITVSELCALLVMAFI